MKPGAPSIVLIFLFGLALAGCSTFIERGITQEPPEGPVPNVVGKPFETACNTLQDKNYSVAYTPTQQAVERGDPVRVLSQSPEAGKEAGPSEERPAGVVKLRLSGPPPEDAFEPEGACLPYNAVTIG